jgi:TusA-related sulfurtransferase
MNTALAGKQDTISDLRDIRSGAQAGSTAVQPATLENYQEKLTAGSNVQISAQNVISATDTTYTAGNGLSLSGTEFSVDTSVIQPKLTAGSNIVIDGNTISATAEPQEQANWTETNTSSVQYIQNKPQNLVQDASYVHTDNNFTTALKDKLDGIESGAEVNVQADWNEADSSADDFIKNKPQNLVQDASYVHTDNNFTTALKDKLDGIASGAEVNVQADWTEADSSVDSFIKNKPALSAVATSGSYTDLSNKPSIPVIGTITL